MTGGRVTGVAGIVTVTAALGGVGVWAAVDSAKKAAVREVQIQASHQLVPNCARSQLVRGYLKIRSRTIPTAPGDASAHAHALFRITDCDRTYAPGYDGRTIFLSRSDEDCFLKLEADGYFDHRPAFTTPYLLRRACST